MSPLLSQSTIGKTATLRPRRAWLTRWPLALAIGGSSGSLMALEILLDPRLPWRGPLLVLTALSIPVAAAGYLAVTLPRPWLGRTAMTIFVGWLLASVPEGAAETYVVTRSSYGSSFVCNHSSIPGLLVLFGVTLLLSAILRWSLIWIQGIRASR